MSKTCNCPPCFCEKRGKVSLAVWSACSRVKPMPEDERDAILKAFDETVEPGTLQKMFSFGKALTQHAASGFSTTDDETYRLRLETCRDCEFYVGDTCKKCGCGMSRKARWAEQKCPLGKWPEPPPSNDVSPA